MATLKEYKRLTVIFRDDMPLLYAGSPPGRRRVTIELTSDQIESLIPQYVGKSGGDKLFEEIDVCFLEE